MSPLPDDIAEISVFEFIAEDPANNVEMLIDHSHDLDAGDALIDVKERRFVVESIRWMWVNDKCRVQFVTAREIPAGV